MLTRALPLLALLAAPSFVAAQLSGDRPLATRFADKVWDRVVELCPGETSAHDEIYDMVYEPLSQPFESTHSDEDWARQVTKMELTAILMTEGQKQGAGMTVVSAVAVLDLLDYGALLSRSIPSSIDADRKARAVALLNLHDCILPFDRELSADSDALLTNTAGAGNDGICGMEWFVFWRRYFEWDLDILRPDHGKEFFDAVMLEHSDWLDDGNRSARCEGVDG